MLPFATLKFSISVLLLALQLWNSKYCLLASVHMAILFILGFIVIFSPCYLAFRIEVLPRITTSAEGEKKWFVL